MMKVLSSVSPEQRAQIAAELRKQGVPHSDKLAELAARAVRITATKVNAPLPLGVSRFGGSPDLPMAFKWPERAGKPLSFLAQLDLTELRHPELPSTGWLAFFYDWTEQPWGF